MPSALRQRSLRLTQAVFLIAAALGAASPEARYQSIGRQLMCPCSCAELLLECNHVGCPDSPGMLNMLSAAVSSGKSERSILEDFQAQYGPTVLAAPMLTRFNIVAWVVPPALLVLGLLGSVALIRRWRRTRTATADAAAMAGNTVASSQIERIRRETEL